jgi:hypothetical protein
MDALIEMFREAPEWSSLARFSCSLPTWQLLHELGETFGWRPTGTTYVAPPGRKITAPAQRNYQPGESRDRKWVAAEDARDWASALQVARRSSHLQAMIHARSVTAGGPMGERDRDELISLIDRFIDFAQGGAFEFAVAPPPAAQTP